jgi:ParB/RepB/Spo0J family partition protein
MSSATTTKKPQGKLAYIEISKISPNKDNPRGIDIQSQDEKLSYLKDSIEDFGVMVPIVVSKRGENYLLIDGERRYWASKALGHETIPAFVLDKDGDFSKRDILFRMFQIHHNREQWGAVQQCNALENLYNAIITKKEIKSIPDERERLSKIADAIVTETGIEERTAVNRVYFLRWPDAVKEKLYSNPNASAIFKRSHNSRCVKRYQLLNHPTFKSIKRENYLDVSGGQFSQTQTSSVSG